MPKLPVARRPGASQGVNPPETGGDGNKIQTLKRQLVRDEILRSAVKLFADHGFHNVSIDKVANGLGYTKSSVYYYFKSKDELLWAVFGYISEHFVGEAERITRSIPDPTSRFVELVRMHVRFLARHKEWATVFYRDVAELARDRQAEVRGINVSYDALFRKAVQEAVDSGRMRSLSPEIVVNAVLGACNWMVNWISSKHRDRVDEIADTYVSLFIEGLIIQDGLQDRHLGEDPPVNRL